MPINSPFEPTFVDILGLLSSPRKVQRVTLQCAVYHSDRAVQYASIDYTRLLEGNEFQISMSRRGNPYDNARAERFMRTLKQEEIWS